LYFYILKKDNLYYEKNFIERQSRVLDLTTLVYSCGTVQHKEVFKVTDSLYVLSYNVIPTHMMKRPVMKHTICVSFVFQGTLIC